MDMNLKTKMELLIKSMNCFLDILLDKQIQARYNLMTNKVLVVNQNMIYLLKDEPWASLTQQIEEVAISMIEILTVSKEIVFKESNQILHQFTADFSQQERIVLQIKLHKDYQASSLMIKEDLMLW